MNWLDKYIRNNNSGYLISEDGGLFVEVDNDYVMSANGKGTPTNLKEITKSEFINKLIN